MWYWRVLYSTKKLELKQIQYPPLIITGKFNHTLMKWQIMIAILVSLTKGQDESSTDPPCPMMHSLTHPNPMKRNAYQENALEVDFSPSQTKTASFHFPHLRSRQLKRRRFRSPPGPSSKFKLFLRLLLQLHIDC